MSTLDVLTSIVAERGGTVRSFTFDGGQTVYVSIPGAPVRTFTSYWGDPRTATELALAFVRPDVPESPVVRRAREAQLPAKELDPWGPERATYDDELDYFRTKTA